MTPHRCRCATPALSLIMLSACADSAPAPTAVSDGPSFLAGTWVEP